jgi:dimethylamine monooxygenase subunit A
VSTLPVAQLNEQLEMPIDAFFDRLTPQRSFWRLGWGILDTPDWYTPIDGTAGPRPSDPAPDQLFLRVERETLRRFPATNCVLFTIRTYVAPIGVVAGDADVARRLADSLAALPDDVRGYKDVRATADVLIASLRGSPSES